MSEIKVDNLTGKTSAGNITVTSEGGAATMQLQQGLTKVWNLATQPNATSLDSFNIASMTDAGTGIMYHHFANNMNNANFSISFTVRNNISQIWNGTGNTDTGQLETRSYTGSSYQDQDHLISVNGDLA